jgi:hypothetical protein
MCKVKVNLHSARVRIAEQVDPATARCFANSLKMSPNPGWHSRNSLKSRFGMIMAERPRIVAFWY